MENVDIALLFGADLPKSAANPVVPDTCQMHPDMRIDPESILRYIGTYGGSSC